MKKLQEMNPFVKIIMVLIFSGLTWFGLNGSGNIAFIGYLSMFAALFIIFEGFTYYVVEQLKPTLFVKIMIALVVAAILGYLTVSYDLFKPEDITAVKPVGSKIFMNCLTMALVPLVFASILTGVTSLGDIHRLNIIGMRTIIYYMITTAIAITIGLTVANVFQPGKSLSPEMRTKFEAQFKDTAGEKVQTAEENRQTLFEGLVAIFPKNIIESVSSAKPDMLALIFFALMCGIALLQLEAKYADPVIKLCSGITEMTVKIIIMVMRLAPYGVFALIASTIAGTGGFELLRELLPFSMIVLLALAIHGVGMNSCSLKFLSKVGPLSFFARFKDVGMTAFSTASSGATMPLTLEVAEKEMGVRNEVAGFVIPLGATINMDGTALFQGISAVFLANVYGIDLTLGGQLTIIGMTVMASIGTAAVPGVGIVILTMVLAAVGIPPEGILFILPVNNLLDMFRTAVNVTGDMTCAIYIDTYDKRRALAAAA